MNERSAIDPHRRDDGWRLASWLALVAAFIALQYASRASGRSTGEPLYTWSFAVGSLVQEAIVLLIVLAIAGFSAYRLGLRLPALKARAVGLAVAAFIAIQAFEVIYVAVVHPGNEQGLTPSHWEPRHAAAYVVNSVIICSVVPFVEEVTFRGLGFHLLRPFGTWLAIAGTGLLFGLSHGLLAELPIIVGFGCALAWLRARTDSVFPGMVVHSAFNALALVLAVHAQR